jgi:hypothetical protein
MINERFQIGRGRRFVLCLLPLLSLPLAIWACSAGTSRQAIPPPVTRLPASQLRLEIQFVGQYEDTPSVQVVTRFFEAEPSQVVSLPEKARLTCNGSDVKPIFPSLMRPCPRQPPGGAYRITYTDEYGATTTVVVPVPAGPFAVLSPRDGATLKIPTNGQLVIRYAIPIAPPKSTVTLIDVTAWCHQSNEQPCDSIAYTAPAPTSATATVASGIPTATVLENHGPPTPTPSSSKSTATVFENHGPPTPVPPPGATPTPPAPDEIVTQSGVTGTIMLIGGFSEYQPGSGKIQIGIVAQITPEQGGFAAASATMGGFVIANITWTR